jgi:hypothetical protein
MIKGSHNTLEGKPLKHTIVTLLCISVLLAACSPAATAPTPLPPTETPAPATATQLQPTLTPEPAQPEIPNIIPVVDNWEGVPVMPEAISGMFEMGDYFYTIHAAEDEITAYYESSMSNLGWEPREDMTNRAPGTTFTFYKEGRFVFFMIRPEGENNQVFMHFVEE